MPNPGRAGIIITISKDKLSNEKVLESASIIRLDSGSAKAGYQLILIPGTFCFRVSHQRGGKLLAEVLQ